MIEQSAENAAEPIGTPRGPLRWACAVCLDLLLGSEHSTAPKDGHAPLRILTRDAAIPPGESQ